MNIFQKIGAAIAMPGDIFDDVAGEGLSPAFFYLAFIPLIWLILIIPTVFILIILVKLLPFIPFEFAVGPLGIFVIKLSLAGVGFYLANLIFSFICAAILHIWCLLWGAVGDYADSYKALVYSSTPVFVFGWIPGINALACVWHFILLGVGLAKLHYLPAVKVTFIILIPLILIGGISVLSYFLWF